VDSRWEGPVTPLTLDFLSKYSLIDGWVGKSEANYLSESKLIGKIQKL